MKFKVGDRVKGKDNINSKFERALIIGIHNLYPSPINVEWETKWGVANRWCYERDLELIVSQHTLYNWRNYITYDIERLQEKIDTSNSEMYRGFSEEEYEKIERHNGTVEELLIWLSKGYVLLEAFAKE